MPKLWVKQSGVWKQVQQMWVKQGGTWKTPTVALINQSGVGKQFYPDTPPTVTYSATGSNFYDVPASITTISVTVVGGGGGGGWPSSGRSGYSQGGGGGGGGAGGTSTTNISVTPGERITTFVGSGGAAGGSGSGTLGGTGSPGTASYISRGATTLLTAAGGNGGGGGNGNPNVGGTGGTGGTGTTSNGNAGSNGTAAGAGGLSSGGAGGASSVGAGGTAGLFPTAGGVGGTGAGGGGGSSSGYSPNDVEYSGAAGGNGLIIIKPITQTVATYSTPNTFTYAVPAGVTSLNVSYPTTTGLVNTTYTVTPLTNLTITIGDYGASSTITGGTGTITMPAYNKAILTHTSGNIDLDLTQTFTVATTNVITASASGTNGPVTTTYTAAGLYFNTDVETNQGDFSEVSSISTVPIASLVGTYEMYFSTAPTGSGSSLTVTQAATLPTAANSWRTQYTIRENNSSNHPATYVISIRQKGYFLISY